jgi:predicted DNA-binding transcriptional regulator YafY
MRPTGEQDQEDYHVFNFECTEAQILYYFIGFGKYAKIISPAHLAEKFLHIYRGAVEQYES